MSKRSITDREISLIKAMIARKMRNKDIQFYFNRPERAVNSGRISNIKSGKYGNSAQISPASDVELDEFLESYSALHSNSDSENESVDKLFIMDKSGKWILNLTESDDIECKKGFSLSHKDKWLKAIAALSNNRGGRIFFGVREKPEIDGDINYEITGIESTEFTKYDLSKISQILKSVFDPTPIISRAVLDVTEGLQVGVIEVNAHPARPVIASKQEGSIREGDIWFRYSAESTRIKHSDLRALLDERDRVARNQILPMVQRLLNLGPGRAMIADLDEKRLTDGQTTFEIDEELIDKIEFIREGHFSDTEGAKTLKLLGNVQAADKTKVITERGVITPRDLITDFLEQRSRAAAREYLKCAVMLGHAAWLPTFFFAFKEGLSIADMVDAIRKSGATTHNKDIYEARIVQSGKTRIEVGGEPARIASEMIEGKIELPQNATEAAALGRAIASLTNKPPISLERTLEALKEAYNLVQHNTKSGQASPVRRAIARIDELYFRPSS